MLLPCDNLISSIRTPCHIHVPWHHPSSPFSQSLGLWLHIMWHVMWLQLHASSLSNKKKKKRNIKLRKMLVSKHTITYKEFYKDHKRTQQEILNIFIHYITSTSLTSNYICYLWLLTKYFKCYDSNCYDQYLMFYRWLPYGWHVLGFVYFCCHLSAVSCCILMYA